MADQGTDAPTSPAECLRLFRAGKARIEELSAGIRDWTVESSEGWTAKDYLAHLTVWQRRLVRWFEEGRQGTARERPEPGYTFDQIDELNERDRRECRNAPPDEVRREFQRTADAAEALIRGLTDADLNDPARAPWLGFEARIAVAGNTYAHYSEHFDALEQLGAG